MKKIVLIALAAFASSYPTAVAQPISKISGKIVNKDSYSKIVLENILSESEIAESEIDSTGHFSIPFKQEQADFYKLKLDDNFYIFLIPTPGEAISLTWDLEKIQNPKIEGSKNSALIYSTLQQSEKYESKADAYALKMQNKKKEMIRKMIKENPGSLACLFFIAELDQTEDAEIYKLLSTGLQQYSENVLVQDLMTKVQATETLAEGSEAPEIALNNPEGKEIKLSSLRGNYVLIDFWAAWCRPCRAESPNMVKIYNKYHDKGFDIYSVSLDANKEDWVGAIEKDGLNQWIHVSDLKYWDSEAAKSYSVSGIPFTVLLDKEGKIIAKGLRGDELEIKLSEIFGTK